MSTASRKKKSDKEVRATNKVPWPRAGYPGHPEQSKCAWNNSVISVGSFPGRLFDDSWMAEFGARWGSTPTGPLEERSFAQMWDYRNNSIMESEPKGFMFALLAQEHRDLVKDEEDLRLLQIASATLVQWLGTNVGRSFIEEARHLAAKEAARLAPEIVKQRKLLQAIGEISFGDHDIQREVSAEKK